MQTQHMHGNAYGACVPAVIRKPKSPARDEIAVVAVCMQLTVEAIAITCRPVVRVSERMPPPQTPSQFTTTARFARSHRT